MGKKMRKAEIRRKMGRRWWLKGIESGEI